MSRINQSADTTTNLQGTVFPRPDYGPSMFRTQQLHPRQFPQFHPRPSQPDWIPAALITCFILLAWVQVFFHKRFRQIVRAPFSRRFINQLTRDGNLFYERIAVALGMVYLLSFTLLLYQFNVQFLHLSFGNVNGLALYGIINLATIVLITAKITVIQFIGTIFKTKETTGSYLLNILIFALLSGPVVLTFLVFMVYTGSVTFLYVSCIVILLINLLRFFRSFMIGMGLRKFSYLFLFVYLCTLEILPLLVLIKILLQHSY